MHIIMATATRAIPTFLGRTAEGVGGAADGISGGRDGMIFAPPPFCKLIFTTMLP